MQWALRLLPSSSVCSLRLVVFCSGKSATRPRYHFDTAADQTTVHSYDTGTISGILAMPYWRKLFSTGYINPDDNWPDVTSSQSSMIVSLLSAGTFFGALGAAPVADYFGRRLGMIINSAVFCVGVILQTAATSIPLFVAGRFFAGFGVGLLSATSMLTHLFSLLVAAY
jgi:MFS family permease